MELQAKQEAPDKRVGQSICVVCNGTVGYGQGTVLHFGAYGRVHTDTCLRDAPAIAQKVTL
jgi:hypothetical protein